MYENEKKPNDGSVDVPMCKKSENCGVATTKYHNTRRHDRATARSRPDYRPVYDIPAAFGAHRIPPLVCAVAIHVFDLKPPFAKNTAGVFGTIHGPSLWHTGFLYQWVYFTIVSEKIQPPNNMYRAVQLKQENSYLEVLPLSQLQDNESRAIPQEAPGY